jgi:hypothetical protein
MVRPEAQAALSVPVILMAKMAPMAPTAVAAMAVMAVTFMHIHCMTLAATWAPMVNVHGGVPYTMVQIVMLTLQM